MMDPVLKRGATFMVGRSRISLISSSLFVWMLTACAGPAATRREEIEPPHIQDEKNDAPPVVLASDKEGIYPEFGCMEFGCPDKVMCGKAACFVTHCGKKSCRFCPESLPDFLKNVVFDQWCAYDCVRGSMKVGSAFGLVTTIGSAFVGPKCLVDDPSASSTSSSSKE
jgi:hypothetical protein